jgi:hypothetical protein
MNSERAKLARNQKTEARIGGEIFGGEISFENLRRKTQTQK